MKNDSILFIGMDTHRGRLRRSGGAKVKDLERISSAKAPITKMACQFESKYPKTTLYLVHEAGLCDY